MTIDVQNSGNTTDDAPSLAMSATDVAQRCLRKIGAYSINDTGPDEAEMAETLFWLEMLIAELTGTQDCFWLTAATLSVPLQPTISSYKLADVPGYPREGVTFVTGCWVHDASNPGNDTPIEIVRRKTYENQSQKSTSGTPEQVYIDRVQPSPTLITYPVLGAGITGFSLRLLLQTYNPSVLAVKGNLPTGSKATGMGVEWNRYLVYALSAEIGDGPVRKIDKADVKDWREVATSSLAKLNSYSNREKRLAGRTRRWGEVPYQLRTPQKRRW